jgi:hypothetical protein
MSYSFVVHPDGTILEGQNGHVGAHTRGQNSTTQAICCVGNFETDPVTAEMVASIRLLVRDFGPLLGGHRDAPGAATACPGRNLQGRLPELRVALPDASTASQVPSEGQVLGGTEVSAEATTERPDGDGWANRPSWVPKADWQRLVDWRRGK